MDPLCISGIDPSKNDLAEAERYGIEERDRLLKLRKLDLLVDLDQTLIHTTNADHYPYSPVRMAIVNIACSLFPCGDSLVCIIDDREDVWNYAKNLVHVKPYLWFKNVGDINDISLPPPPSPGNQLIPPISEQEFQKQLENSQQIQDERNELENNTILEHLNRSQSINNIEQGLPRGEKRRLDTDTTDNNYETSSTTSNDDTNNKRLKQNDEPAESNEQMTDHYSATIEKTLSDTSVTSKFELSPEQQPQQETIQYNDYNLIIQDEDTYLNQLEIILKRIHEAFYNAYDIWLQTKQRDSMPDLKQIVPDIRRQVLSDASICFSGIMHVDHPLEKHRAYIIAKALGANVTKDLALDDGCGDDDTETSMKTTHLVAGKETQKVHRARKHNIHVVTPEWLIDCYEQWEAKNEMNYLLDNKYDVRKSRLFIDEGPRGMKRLRGDGDRHHHRYDQKQDKTTVSKSTAATDSSNRDKNTQDIAEALQQSQTPQGEDSGTTLTATNNESISSSTVIKNNEEDGNKNHRRRRNNEHEFLFSMSMDELEEMEKEVDDFCSDTNDDDDDDEDNEQSKPNDLSKYDPTFEEEENDDDLDGEDAEQEETLRNLVLGTNRKAEYNDSDEDSLGGGDVPKGWKKEVNNHTL
ncbi:unnamed protein product [Didymodactylos carnosus]|uniref:protein-serine/threonine phosphatase n=1 Tax=Didymodactylos carnosus TaxID=1234261 RepID=A0A813RWL9_9BILA|nr:unnamed protein product [Didymodactylos carnosus]CAF1129940.1 unnamed protein product [Didymodactylos carnosus]CAF3570918.1 unnamed protein product [Didymodactylos carnosus]CAF3911939.1 unnamed protein product [Didymodactylos carnosus]